jgi:hypothetical protein
VVIPRAIAEAATVAQGTLVLHVVVAMSLRSLAAMVVVPSSRVAAAALVSVFPVVSRHYPVVVGFVLVASMGVPDVLVEVEARHIAHRVRPLGIEHRMDHLPGQRATQRILESLPEFIGSLGRRGGEDTADEERSETAAQDRWTGAPGRTLVGAVAGLRIARAAEIECGCMGLHGSALL